MTRFVLIISIVLAAACSSGGSSPAASTSSTAAGCTSSTTVAGSDGGAEVSPPGDIPDDQAFVQLSPATRTYSVKVPEGWARTDDGDHITFSDKLNSIDVNVVAAPTAPTVESAKADEVPTIAQTAKCFRVKDVTTVRRSSGDMVLITYNADSAPDPVTGKVVLDDVERYEAWANGKEAILTLSGPAGSDNVDPWKIVTDSFTWT